MVDAVLVVAALVAAPLATGTPAEANAPLRVATAGELPALDAELLSVFAKSHSRAVELVTGAASAVTGGLADVATGLYADAVTAADLVTTREVFPSRLVAVTREPAARAEAIERLRWSRIGILRGSRAPAAIHDAKISGAELTQYAGVDAALSGLRRGEIASLLLELPEALLAQRRDGRLELGAFLGARRSCVYAVRRGDSSLLAELNAYMRNLQSTPSWRSIVTRHYGRAAIETLWRARLVD